MNMSSPLDLDFTLRSALPPWLFEQLSLVHKSREKSFSKALVKACAQAPLRSAAFEGLCLFHLEQIDKAAFQDEASRKLFQIMVNTLQLTSFLAGQESPQSVPEEQEPLREERPEIHTTIMTHPLSTPSSILVGTPIISQPKHSNVISFSEPASQGGALASKGVRLKTNPIRSSA